MKSRSPVFLMTVLAASVSAALAQEVPPFTGSVSLTGVSTHVTSQNRFRFEEFRDLDSGVTGGFDVRTQSSDWYHRFFGENLGRDDQFEQAKGGKYGVFNKNYYGDDIIHNLTFGAITPFSGVGTNNLTFTGTPPPATNPALWNGFDYRVKHRNVGGVVEGQLAPDSPFYVRVAANRKKSDGIRPLGEPGTSPGGPNYELPAPIDWRTTDVSGEFGYSTKTMHFSVTALWSKFEDANDFLFWRAPVVVTGANQEISTISADNNLRRLAFNGVVKQMPLDSTLAVRATYTKLTNSFPIGTTYINISGTTGNLRLANPSEPTFEGEVVNKSFSVAYNSNLARDWSSKVYYNWYKRDNNSTEVVFRPSGPGSGGTCDFNPVTGAALTTCSTEFLRFEKKNVGAEVQWRIARANKLTLGLDYLDTERERIDFDRSKETRATIEWKSGSWDVADVRLKYIHLNRKSDFLEGGALTTTGTPDIFARNLFRFDAAPLDRDTIKLVLDANPLPLLDLGGELAYKHNRYKDTLLGRTSDTRQEIAVSASYGPPELRFTAFADYEHTVYDSRHWVGATTTFPNSNAAGTTFLWQSDVKDKNYLVGVAADWRALERLRIVGSAIWQKADGSVDFAAFSTTRIPSNITAYDNFTKKTLNVKGMYAATKQLDVTVGAAYEKYDYSDIQMDAYIYNLRVGANQSYLSGAYAFPNYKASIVYATLTYRF
jgi:hypothetical protein